MPGSTPPQTWVSHRLRWRKACLTIRPNMSAQFARHRQMGAEHQACGFPPPGTTSGAGDTTYSWHACGHRRSLSNRSRHHTVQNDHDDWLVQVCVCYITGLLLMYSLRAETFAQVSGSGVWAVSPEATGLRQLAIITLLRPFLDHKGEARIKPLSSPRLMSRDGEGGCTGYSILLGLSVCDGARRRLLRGVLLGPGQ